MEHVRGARMVVVPYTPDKLRPETARWAADNNARMRDVSGDPEAYLAALCDWWSEPGDLLVVEHDMLPASGVVEEMLDCPELWCSSPYRLALVEPRNFNLHGVKFLNGLPLTIDGVTSELANPKLLDHLKAGGAAYCTDGLGCTKFSAELKARMPNVVVESKSGGRVRAHAWLFNWLFNDVRISGALRRNGLTPHLHAPSVHLTVP